MTEEEVKRKIADIFCDPLVIHYHKLALELAGKVLALPEIAILDPDQTLPVGDLKGQKAGEWWSGYGSGYIDAQADMLKAGFRRVKGRSDTPKPDTLPVVP